MSFTLLTLTLSLKLCSNFKIYHFSQRSINNIYRRFNYTSHDYYQNVSQMLSKMNIMSPGFYITNSLRSRDNLYPPSHIRRILNLMEDSNEYIKYRGNVVLLNKDNIDEHDDRVINTLNTSVIGFDLEYAPDFYTSIRKDSITTKPSLVQVCGDSICYIYLIYKLGYFPRSLLDILSSTNLLKISHGAPSDMRILYKSHGISSKNFVDLRELCKDNGIHPTTLKNATEHFLKMKLSKKQQCSDWEANQLTDEQIEYASTDAWVTREIYLKLNPQKITKLQIDNGDVVPLN